MSRLEVLKGRLPREWQDFLHKVRQQFPNAIIAGGCLRDLDYGKDPSEIKDIDIFVPRIDFRQDDEFHKRVLKILGTAVVSNSSGIREYQEGYDEEAKQGRSIYGLYKHIEGGYTYEIILSSDQTADITDFDFSICQIGYNGHTVFSTSAYEETYGTNIIKLVNPRPPHRTNDRAARMSIKFPSMEMDLSSLATLDE